MRRTASRIALAQQLWLLEPGRVIALGVAAAEFLQDVYRGSAEMIVLPRRIGDTAITPEAERRLAELRHVAAPADPEAGHSGEQQQEVSEHAEAAGDAAELQRRGPKPSDMSFQVYEAIARDLGFAPPERGKMLRHRSLNSTVYINRRRDGFVYFTIYRSSLERFTPEYWLHHLRAQQKKDDKPQLRAVVPKEGVERLALESLLESQ